jgi:uncharacterized membrane protein YqjE
MTESRKGPAETDVGLPALITRLGEDILTLVDSRLGLLKIEIKEDINAYARSGMAVSAGAVVAALGVALLGVALAFSIAWLMRDTTLDRRIALALGFALVGGACLLIGLAVVSRSWRRASGG